MSEQDLSEMGRFLYAISKNFSLEDFAAVVENMGGKTFLYLCVIPLDTHPYCAVFIRRHPRYGIELGKAERLDDPISIPNIPAYSREYEKMLPELVDTMRKFINNLFPPCESESEYAERFAHYSARRSVCEIMSRFQRSEQNHVRLRLVRRNEKRSEFNSFVEEVFRTDSEIKKGLTVPEIARRQYKYTFVGKRVFRRTNRKLITYCNVGLMMEKDGRFIPLEYPRLTDNQA
jgi:hypothetical protein